MTTTDTVELTAIEPDEPASGRRRLVVLGLLVGVTALVVVFLFVVQPMLAPPVVVGEAPVPPAGSSASTPAADAAPAEAPEVALTAPTVHTFVGGVRSPFQQLVTDTSDGVVVTEGTTLATTLPSTTATTGTTGTATTGTAPSGTHVGTALVRLVGVAREDGHVRAHITVDGVGYMVGAGEPFATSYRLEGITGDCATMSVAANRFTLCAGEELRK